MKRDNLKNYCEAVEIRSLFNEGREGEKNTGFMSIDGQNIARVICNRFYKLT